MTISMFPEKLNLKAETEIEEKILAYLKENASDELIEKINAGNKTLLGSWRYVMDRAHKMAKGQNVLAFVYRESDPDLVEAAIEYDLERQQIMQCYGYRNCKSDPKIREFARKAFAGELKARVAEAA